MPHAHSGPDLGAELAAHQAGCHRCAIDAASCPVGWALTQAAAAGSGAARPVESAADQGEHGDQSPSVGAVEPAG